MSDHDVILTALEAIRSANEASHKDIRTLVMTEVGSVRLEVSGTNKRLDKMNGNVEKLQDESDRRAAAVTDFRNLEKDIKNAKKKWFWVFLGLVVLIVVVATMVDVFGTKYIMEAIIQNIP